MNSIGDAGGKGPLRSPGWNLAVSTVAFTLCFAAWSLISPFAKTFKHDLHLSYTEALLLTAVPVVLGSLLRIPVGTDPPSPLS
jgi:NNP family nitrate/nitrite transporter-like MFS transporter